MATYPGGIKTFTTQVNKTSPVIDEYHLDAADVNGPYDEIVAIETELGTDPRGSHATVKARIIAAEAYMFPVGGIIMWSGLLANIPTGWSLCLTGDSEVLLADGSTRTIQEIVESKLRINVVSFNEKTRTYESKKVVNWNKSPANRNEWVKIVITKGKGSGKRTLELTKTHPVLTQRGYVKAGNLTETDSVIRYEKTLTEKGKQALLGMYLGDGCRYKDRLTIVHGLPQQEYLNYLSTKLQTKIHYSVQKSGYGKNKTCGKISKSLKTFCPQILELMKIPKVNREILNNLGDVGLAYWYMDDGSLAKDKRYPSYYKARLHTDGFSQNEIKILQRFFTEKGIKTRAYLNSWKRGHVIHFERETQDRFFEMISPYVIPSLQYKLPGKYRNRETNLQFIENANVPFNIVIRELTAYSPSKRNLSKYNYKYDIEVEDNHSFVANGFTVHNCDGGGGRPDLRDKFIVGASAGQNPGGTGGSNSKTLTTNELPNHAHTGSSAGSGNHSHTTTTSGSHTHTGSAAAAGSHNHNYYGNSVGVSWGAGQIIQTWQAGGNTSHGTSTNGSHGHGTLNIDAAGNHAHTTDAPGDHTHVITVNSNGNGAAFDNRPAFYTMAFIIKT